MLNHVESTSIPPADEKPPFDPPGNAWRTPASPHSAGATLTLAAAFVKHGHGESHVWRVPEMFFFWAIHL